MRKACQEPPILLTPPAELPLPPCLELQLWPGSSTVYPPVAGYNTHSLRAAKCRIEEIVDAVDSLEQLCINQITCGHWHPHLRRRARLRL